MAGSQLRVISIITLVGRLGDVFGLVLSSSGPQRPGNWAGWREWGSSR